MKKNGERFTELVLEVFKLNGLLLAEGDRIAGEYELSSARWKVLGSVAISGRPMTVAQIGRHMGQARQSVQRIANEMAESGYFTWEDNPSDKRAMLLKLTAKGKRVYKQLEAEQAQWANEAASGLPPDELDSALKVLRRLSDQFGT
ncbi:MarR family transcriptional regulator [Bremerella cremea]|uniref:MarR family transcriptional regulator n=1 Tax=Bremerella cremea TaxID=1031537 RepID=A0A368KN28_9BACT|nr:MarR family transcriptional regulator [Bremerella cremea]RCS44643.1 MarR family transcriptional regulator [Bremerella cremea]